MFISHVADYMITSGRFTHTTTRKIINSIGQYGFALALIGASYAGCNPWLTVGILTVGLGLNGGIYSGFKVNHLDISPRFAGILMSFTNCLANLAGIVAPTVSGYIISGKVNSLLLFFLIENIKFARNFKYIIFFQPSQAKWRIVFMLAAGTYIVCATFYVIFASGERQPWDNPDKDKDNKATKKKDVEAMKSINESQH